MPNSKQHTTKRIEPFYSRVYNQWFKNYDSFLQYKSYKNKQFKKESKQNLTYDKNTGYLSDKKTKKRLSIPVKNWKTRNL